MPEDMFGALQGAQANGNQVAPGMPARPGDPAMPSQGMETPADAKVPTREVKVTDKQPDGSELSMVLKGDDLQNERIQFLLQALVDSGSPTQQDPNQQQGVIPPQPVNQQI